MFDSSFLVNFFNVLSDIAIANLKLHFKKSPLQLKNLNTYQNTYPLAMHTKYKYKFKKSMSGLELCYRYFSITSIGR